MRRGAAVAAALLLSAAAAPLLAPAATEREEAAVRHARRSIQAAALGAHVKFLADDALEGRGTGTRGYDLAARYVASRFEGAGLEPAGPGGSWYQQVPMRSAAIVPAGCGVTLIRPGGSVELALERDFLMGGDPLRQRSEVTAPVVFAGYGITAPELGHDDFAGLDARGKIVAVLSGAPPRFPPTLRAHYSNSRVKDANLAKHGAVGFLTIRTAVDERRASWERSVRQSRFASIRWVDRSGVPDGVEPALQCSATLSRGAAERLFEGASRNLEWALAAGERERPEGLELPLRVRLRRQSRHQPLSSPNVIGLLRGSDPRLRDERVVLTAHLDHLGVGTPVRGDSIYNGAFDNATGIAALIEVAAAFAGREARPRRSLLFVAVTGEEKGLQGSGYFVAHPPPLAGRMVADLNLDMLVMLGPLQDLVAYGGEHSTLGEAARRAASDFGIEVVPDPVPEEVIFVRSDQYSFVRQGIPALFLVGRAGPERPAARGEWMRTLYHSPQDDLAQPYHLEALAQFARVHYRLAGIVADQTAPPAWKPKDFFGERFGRRGRSAGRARPSAP